MTNRVKIALGLLVLAGLLLVTALYLQNRQTTQILDNNPQENEQPVEPINTRKDIEVISPQVDQSINSPLTISGKARGTWFFEAQFSARLLDGTGKELGVAILTAQGEWMTEEFVPFTGQLIYNKPTSEKGVLVFERSNPSGLPENDAEFRVPVKF